MAQKPLQPGTQIEFVSRHLELPDAELLEKGKTEGFKIVEKNLRKMRWLLRTKYGFDNTGVQPRAYKAKGPRTKPVEGKKRGPYKKRKKQASPADALKLSQLRKLIFELGWDAAHDIFSEFMDMHNRWGG